MKIMTALALSCVLCGSAYAQKPPHPSADAARKVVSEYLVQVVGVPAESIQVEMPRIVGGSAMTHATFKGQKCDFSLIEDKVANEYGWIIETQICRKA